LSDEEKSYISELNRNAGRSDAVNFALFEKVQPLAKMTTSGGSDDTGDVSQVVPLCKVETCANIIGAHTWHFASISGTTIGSKALINASKVLYMTALDLYTKPKELKAVRDEFEAAQGKNYREKYRSLSGDIEYTLPLLQKQATK
jgi:aminobenzoyl-glutamate utilization protein B